MSFSEAATVLSDPFALTREDPQAAGEQRFVTLGLSDTGNLLVVVYTHREPDVFRVISSRPSALSPMRPAAATIRL